MRPLIAPRPLASTRAPARARQNHTARHAPVHSCYLRLRSILIHHGVSRRGELQNSVCNAAHARILITSCLSIGLSKIINGNPKPSLETWHHDSRKTKRELAPARYNTTSIFRSSLKGSSTKAESSTTEKLSPVNARCMSMSSLTSVPPNPSNASGSASLLSSFLRKGIPGTFKVSPKVPMMPLDFSGSTIFWCACAPKELVRCSGERNFGPVKFEVRIGMVNSISMSSSSSFSLPNPFFISIVGPLGCRAEGFSPSPSPFDADAIMVSASRLPMRNVRAR
mmetsp:Transcript_10339/g.30955  ORF Transcript_10339/g.30955 Transcript_10339/m.30955 type:complete len:281 (+) Transcript_10339:915-1757(+)